MDRNGTVEFKPTDYRDLWPNPSDFSYEKVRFYKPSQVAGDVIAVMEDGTQFAVKERKVAILGRAPSTVNQAPFDDPTWEIWSLSNAAAVGQVPRWDVWFELHPMDTGLQRWDEQYRTWLATDHGKKIYIGENHPHIPHGVRFPWELMFKKFGRYFNNSISEMIAAALLEGATELAIYGVDMAQSDPAMHNGNPEYQHQRPSCEHMIGVAETMLGRDKVHVPIESDLLKCAKIYAFQGNDNALLRKCIARKKELKERHADLMNQIGQRNAKIKQDQAEVAELTKYAAKFEGAMEDNDYWMTRVQA